MTTPKKIQQRHLTLMQHSLKALGNILQRVTQAEATTYRDNGDGWTILEVVCHLRDFDEIFHNRAVMILESDYPDLPGYNHEAMAVERAYNRQNLQSVYADLAAHRRQFVAFFEGLSEDQWARAGDHPERGYFTMTDAIMQVGTHEVNHLEQITRILAEAKTK